MTFKKSEDLTNNFNKTKEHICKTNGLLNFLFMNFGMNSPSKSGLVSSF